MAKKKDRTILTPSVTTDFTSTGGLTYWKQILPESEIQYTDDTGATRKINFDKNYHRDCIKSFRAKAIDQTHFQLADSRNGHGRDFDPERQRALVQDMATYDDLPDDIKAKVGNRGLYAKLRFFNKKAAKAIKQNTDLGVSARVRENFTRADGTFVKRAVIHVLGTIDPRVTGMSGWQGADLGYSAEEGSNVLDLSNESYQGADMAKGKNKVKGGSVATIPSDDEIEAMTDAELDEFLAQGESLLAANDPDNDDDDENDDDDDEGNTPGADEVNPDGTRKTPNQETASMSNSISLANAAAATANARANQALARSAAAEWASYRSAMILAGVPAADLDLAEPALNRADSMVVDLSNEVDANGAQRDDVNMTEIVRKLVEARKGTVDMSNESGHAGSVDLANGENDPDSEFLEAWSETYGD